MDRVQALLPSYRELLSRYVLTEDQVEREVALIGTGELAKSALAEGPLIDQMHELHLRAQRALAGQWREAPANSPPAQARERLVQGEALPMLLALMLPHELAQRAHHEQRWRREHETLVAMFEQTDQLIVVLDADGQCDDVNPAFCRSTGWTRRQAVEGAGAWADPPEGKVAQRRRTRQPCHDGTGLTIDWSVSPIFGRKGELQTYVCIGRDVDRQQKVEDSLRENDKLRAVATLAGGIAHDFNNLLGSILGLTELCEVDATPGTRQARNLARIREASNKAAKLVRQMLDFSRQTPPDLKCLSFSECLAHSQGLLRAAMPRHQGLVIEQLEDGAVRVDLVQMEQVLLNVVRNASQAMGERPGEVRIVVDRADPWTLQPSASASRHLRVRVIDQGEGIAPDLLGKIFEPFFTTKPVGEGTGLGLAAVHGIVSAHQGRVEVASEVGSGTTFSIFLPLTDAGPDAAAS
jgi:PAS domain S-box-containing protein